MKYQNLNIKLDALRAQSHFRQPRTLHCNAYHATAAAHTLVNFSSNDYLGIAGDAKLQTSFFETALKDNTHNWMSASSSRALTGTSSSHSRLEDNIAGSYGRQSALVFNSGYHANCGILPALSSSEDLILSDELIHASLIDGIRLGKATYKRFSHNDLESLEALLTKYRHEFRDVWIVTESLFSMDGDYAPLAELVWLKNKFNAYLYVDEAHAVGCIGPTGLGLADELGLIDDIDLLVGTFGKALAGYGGFVVGDKVLTDAMINFARPWIFSTALPPMVIDWNNFIWQKLTHLTEYRETLSQSSNLFRQGLSRIGKQSIGNSHIIPLIAPGNEHVMKLASQLEKSGILALAIRAPTVASGKERIRFSLTASIPEDQLQRCLSQIERIV